MSFKKLAVIAAFSAVSAAAFAANPGVITFKGEIVTGACGISGDTLNQTVNLGQVPANTFKAAGDRSEVVNFPIILTDCDTTTQKNAKFTFTGAAADANAELFGTTGSASGVGIRLQAPSGEILKNGTEQSSNFVLSNGNNTVMFGAMYESTAAKVTPGVADSVANFTVAYY
ncbi:fimbrial protein [Variovorax dokdonensis]|uniref:Fimbrial protein n=1 Tax=Variovorax dokdonensis TaxID=344883 RepID=A0ABT7NES7_9BURK|nr:fimbrial protein [Variovorax dokdonensis]MDM0046455.1 fimbrial protein [Variovorax dokdonensis]